VTDPAFGVEVGQDIRVDGHSAVPEGHEVWVVNKPVDVISTADEPGKRSAVVDLVVSAARLYPVGRLDADSTGIILLSNDGELANRLTHPRYGVKKTYRVHLRHPVSDAALRDLAKGVRLDDGPTAPAEVSRNGDRSFDITIREGRNRQIRRSLLILGFPVRRLVRERIGPLRLDGLAVGEARPLDPEERTTLLAHVARLKTAEPAPRSTTTRKPKLGLSKARLSGRPERPGAARAASRPERGGGGGPARPQRGASSRKGVKK
jgi:23S rRNA pseudouridine2605 synthase